MFANAGSHQSHHGHALSNGPHKNINASAGSSSNSSTSSRSNTDKRAMAGNAQLRPNAPENRLPNNMALRLATAQDILTPTVRQRLAEARKTCCLDLSHQNLPFLPPQALALENITTLILRDNDLTAVPPNLADAFPRLVHVDLSANRIERCQSSLAGLADLEVLDLSGNESLRGGRAPAAFGPLRSHVALFIDDEDHADDDDDEEENDADEDDDRSDVDDGLRSDVCYDPVAARNAGVEDEARRFFGRLTRIRGGRDLGDMFRAQLARGDQGFIRYLSRRYADDTSEDYLELVSPRSVDHMARVLERKRDRLEMFYARKEKEKVIKLRRAARRGIKQRRNQEGGAVDDAVGSTSSVAVVAALVEL